jgi:hypothetical protein
MDLGDLQYANAHGFFNVSPNFTVTTAPTPSLPGYSQQPESAFSTSPQSLNDQQSFPLADISAMMFSSADPFAYPNQPSGTDPSFDDLLKSLGSNPSFPFPAQLEAFRMQRMNGANHDFVPPSSTFLFGTENAPENAAQETDVQLLGAMPMYLMQGGPQHSQQPQQSNNFAHSMSSSPAPRSMPIRNQNNFHQPQSATNKYFPNANTSNMNLEQLLGGEEWAGLPADRTGAAPNINAFASPGPFPRRTLPSRGPGVAPATANSGIAAEGMAFGDLTWGLEGY